MAWPWTWAGFRVKGPMRSQEHCRLLLSPLSTLLAIVHSACSSCRRALPPELTGAPDSEQHLTFPPEARGLVWSFRSHPALRVSPVLGPRGTDRRSELTPPRGGLPREPQWKGSAITCDVTSTHGGPGFHMVSERPEQILALLSSVWSSMFSYYGAPCPASGLRAYMGSRSPALPTFPPTQPASQAFGLN